MDIPKRNDKKKTDTETIGLVISIRKEPAVTQQTAKKGRVIMIGQSSKISLLSLFRHVVCTVGAEGLNAEDSQACVAEVAVTFLCVDADAAILRSAEVNVAVGMENSGATTVGEIARTTIPTVITHKRPDTKKATTER